MNVTQATPQNFLPPDYKVGNAAAVTATDNTRSFSDAVRVLIRVLSSRDQADDTRREAAFALGAIGDPAALPVLSVNAGSKDVYLAEICREALMKLTKTE
jgi:hypothetical protein